MHHHSPHLQGGDVTVGGRGGGMRGREGGSTYGGRVGGCIISKGQCEYSDCSQLDKTVSEGVNQGELVWV